MCHPNDVSTYFVLLLYRDKACAKKTVRSLQHSSSILQLSRNVTFMSELEIASLMVYVILFSFS